MALFATTPAPPGPTRVTSRRSRARHWTVSLASSGRAVASPWSATHTSAAVVAAKSSGTPTRSTFCYHRPPTRIMQLTADVRSQRSPSLRPRHVPAGPARPHLGTHYVSLNTHRRLQQPQLAGGRDAIDRVRSRRPRRLSVACQLSPPGFSGTTTLPVQSERDGAPHREGGRTRERVAVAVRDKGARSPSTCTTTRLGADGCVDRQVPQGDRYVQSCHVDPTYSDLVSSDPPK